MVDTTAGVDENGEGAVTEQELNDDARAPEDQQDGTDWEAIAKKAIEDRDNYKTALTQKRGLRKKPQVSEEEADEEDDDDKPLTRREMREMLQEEVIPVVAQGKVDTALTSMVKDPAKRKLVKLYYDTRIRQTGTSDDAIRSDVQAAIAIADSHKLRNASAEIDRVHNTERALPANGSGSDRGLPMKEHGFSKEQVAQLTEQAKGLGADPAVFIKKTWDNTKPR